MAISKDDQGRPNFGKRPKELSDAATDYRRLLLVRALQELDENSAQDEPRLNEARELLANETVQRIDALFSHYGISQSGLEKYVQLALCLAKDFVPNFDVYARETPRGRPRGREIVAGMPLFFAVRELVERDGKKVTEACAALSKRAGPWKGKKVKSIEIRYYQARTEYERIEKIVQSISRGATKNPT